VPHIIPALIAGHESEDLLLLPEVS
jgi:hypothetical protein